MATSGDADRIKAALAELEQASHAVSKAMYESASRAQAAGPAPGGPEGATAGAAAGKGPDDAIDAEFEVKE